VELQNIVFKAIEKDPSKRYQSVQEMHDAVTDLLLSFTSHP
jgi:serine/threonine protein kinase